MNCNNPFVRRLRRRLSACFFREKKADKDADEGCSNNSTKKAQQIQSPESHGIGVIRDALTAERTRVDEIKELMDSKDYEAALLNMMSDTDEDLHYFNHIKNEALGEEHNEAFISRHGKLLDFEERPVPTVDPNICLWSGTNDFGHTLKCHNNCLMHPIERVVDQLGVERPKPLDFCVYHTKYCVRTDNHTIPVRIRIPNEMGLCNECFVLQNGQKPKALLRIPGTRRKRVDRKI